MAYTSNPKPLEEINATLFDDQNDPSKLVLQQIWWRNILYYANEQWIDWHKSQGTFIRRRQDTQRQPTPTANIIRENVRSMKAMVLNKEYSTRIWPNSDDLIDKDAADIGNDVLTHLDSLNSNAFEDQKELVCIFLNLMGTAFIRTYPAMESGEWAIDKAGNILTLGDVGCEALTGFNVCLPSLGSTLRRKPYIGIKSLKSKEWVEDTFKQNVVGDGDDVIDYQRKMMNMVATVSPWKGATTHEHSFDQKDQDMVLFKEIEFRPTKKYPKGRYIQSVGTEILLDIPRLPIKAEKGRWEYSLTDFHYHKMPGRFWSDSSVDDLISPQDSINKIDQALIMNRQGIGKPMVLTSSDISIKRVNQGSQALTILKYDPLFTNNKPEFSKGIALPEQVLVERQIHRGVAQDASGDPKNVLKGGSPQSQASGSLVSILKESAEQGHSPDIKRFYRSLQSVYKKRLLLAQEIYKEERIIKVSGKGKEIKIKKFKGADLHNNTDVRLELDRSAASTQAGQVAMMTEMAKSGVFGDLSQRPDIVNELMLKVGIKGFQDSTNIHIEYTKRENAIVAEIGVEDMVQQPIGGNIETGELAPMIIPGLYMTAVDYTDPEKPQQVVISHDPTFKTQNHAICMDYHLRFILSPEFKAIQPLAQMAMINHYDGHNQALQLQQQEQLQFQNEQLEREGRAKQPQLKNQNQNQNQNMGMTQE